MIRRPECLRDVQRCPRINGGDSAECGGAARVVMERGTCPPSRYACVHQVILLLLPRRLPSAYEVSTIRVQDSTAAAGVAAYARAYAAARSVVMQWMRQQREACAKMSRRIRAKMRWRGRANDKDSELKCVQTSSRPISRPFAEDH